MSQSIAPASESRFDVLGIGCAAVDERLYLSQFPTADTKVRILERNQSLGGLTAIALVAAARMGARAAYAGRLGSDEHSQFVERTLVQSGVNTNEVVRDESARPGRSTILIDEAATTRAVLSEVLGARGADETRPHAELIQRSRVLYIDGHGLPGSIRAARIARAAGCSVVADFERQHEGDFETLLELVDHLIVPAEFAARLTGQSDPAKSVAALHCRGRVAVVVTHGGRGGYYCDAGGTATAYAAFRVPAHDTNGCGDVFHGVYAAGLAFGWDIATRIRYAAAAAALKATARGGTESIPERATVERFLANSPPANDTTGS